MRLALGLPGVEPKVILIIVILVHHYQRVFLRDYPPQFLSKVKVLKETNVLRLSSLLYRLIIAHRQDAKYEVTFHIYGE